MGLARTCLPSQRRALLFSGPGGNDVRNIGELRAEVARQLIPRYKLAAEVGVHPARFGRMLNEKERMPEHVYQLTCERLRVVPSQPE